MQIGKAFLNELIKLTVGSSDLTCTVISKEKFQLYRKGNGTIEAGIEVETKDGAKLIVPKDTEVTRA